MNDCCCHCSSSSPAFPSRWATACSFPWLLASSSVHSISQGKCTMPMRLRPCPAAWQPSIQVTAGSRAPGSAWGGRLQGPRSAASHHHTAVKQQVPQCILQIFFKRTAKTPIYHQLSLTSARCHGHGPAGSAQLSEVQLSPQFHGNTNSSTRHRTADPIICPGPLTPPRGT